jgi:hypothetical protein
MAVTSTLRRPTLDLIRIASPCPAKWEEMTGDERQRHCSLCNLNVYNLSELSREEAEAFLAEREGRVCVRLYRRQDGTVITHDCPVGLAAVRAQVVRLALATASLFLACTATALAALDKIPGVSSYLLPYLSVGKIGHLHMQHSPQAFFTVGAICLPPVSPITSTGDGLDSGAAPAPLPLEE